MKVLQQKKNDEFFLHLKIQNTELIETLCKILKINLFLNEKNYLDVLNFARENNCDRILNFSKLRDLETIQILRHLNSEMTLFFKFYESSQMMMIIFTEESKAKAKTTIEFLIVLEKKSDFFSALNFIIKNLKLGYKNIINADGFLEIIKNSNNYCYFKKPADLSFSNFWSENSSYFFTMFANALVDKIWNHKIFHFKNLNHYDYLKKLNGITCSFPFKDLYEFFSYARDWSSMKTLLRNSNIKKISFLYAPEILPKLNIFLSYKKETVKLNTKRSNYENIIKISIVFSRKNEFEEVKNIKIVILIEEKHFSDFTKIIDFFSLNRNSIFNFLIWRFKSSKFFPSYNWQIRHIAREIISIISQKFTLKFSINDRNPYFQFVEKYINEKNEITNCKTWQVGNLPRIFKFIAGFIREKKKFYLSNLTFRKFHVNYLNSFVPTYEFKFLIKVNWMMKRFLYFFQMLKAKKKYVKLRKQIFNEIYVQILKGFDSKLEKFQGIKFPKSHYLKLTSIDINFN